MSNDEKGSGNQATDTSTVAGYTPLEGVAEPANAPVLLDLEPLRSRGARTASGHGARRDDDGSHRIGPVDGSARVPGAPRSGALERHQAPWRWALLWLLVGIGVGTLGLSSVQRCCSPASSPRRVVLQGGAPGGETPSFTTPSVASSCPPNPAEQGPFALDPVQRAELVSLVERARGERIAPGSDRAVNLARALLTLGDDAAARVRPVTEVVSREGLQRTISEPIEHYRVAVDFYGRVARYDYGLVQCSMVRMAACSERLADTFDETAGAPSVLAVDPTYYPESLRTLARTYREMAMQQYEIALQVHLADPECTRRASEAFQRLMARAHQ